MRHIRAVFTEVEGVMESEMLNSFNREAESDGKSAEQDVCVSHGWRSAGQAGGGVVVVENLTVVTGFPS